MSALASLAVGVAFIWLGMVVAISFIEAPLKFRVPEVTLPMGLRIGRVVFRALNTAEIVLAALLVVALTFGPIATTAQIAIGVALAALAIQLLGVRPRLTRRSDAVLAGALVERSRLHHFYVGLELVKVVALLTGGIVLLVTAAGHAVSIAAL